MEVKNEMFPVTDEQKRKLAEPGPDGPIIMLNLLKFREKAVYPDGSDSDMSGRDAYERFLQPAVRHIQERGGRVLYDGDVTYLMVGQAEDLWDQVAAVEYPSRTAFVAMLTDPEFQELFVHRDAALEGQLNIETIWHPTDGDDWIRH